MEKIDAHSRTHHRLRTKSHLYRHENTGFAIVLPKRCYRSLVVVKCVYESTISPSSAKVLGGL